MAENNEVVEYKVGQVVELVEAVSLLYRRKPIARELIFLPGTRAKVVPTPCGLEDFLMIEVDGLRLVVRPDQVKYTGETVEWLVVSEEDMEAE